jgi:guanylate kinase
VSEAAARRGLVICVSGPSGVGKGTVIRRLLERAPHLAHSISVTTRQPRPGETDGVEYYFRSREAFADLQSAGDILESDSYCGNLYGTPRQNLENLVSRGVDVIMDITVPGSLAIMTNYPEAIPVFLMPPSFTELERRLARRGTEDVSTMQVRLAKAREEIGKARLFRYIVVNDDLDDTVNSILAVICAEHLRSDRCPGLEATILAR